VDRDGRPVDTLGPDDFTVTVDGRPRRVSAVKHVSRGPGAAESAALVASRGGRVTTSAEPARDVLVVVDETLMERGDEPAAVRAGAALLDRLGLSDRVAIVRVPTLVRTAITLTTDRPSAREDLRTVAGQIGSARAAEEPARAETPARVDDPSRAAGTGDPDKAAVAERDQQQIAATDTPAQLTPEMLAHVRDSLGGLRELLVSLRAAPGRKAVVMVSCGLPRGWNEVVRENDLREVAAAAAAARTTLHVLGLRATHSDPQASPELTPYETLARYTGGSFAVLDKQVDRTVERLMPSLASCYVLSLDTTAEDRDGKRHALRIETSRKGVALRAPTVLVPTDEPEDTVVSLPTRAANSTPAALPAPANTAAAGGTGRPVEARPRENPNAGADARPGREAELSLLLSRAVDYVAGYQKAFSAVVAEETYVQTAGSRSVRLVSDFLLVRPVNGGTWVSFRDVFQVNGERVRDRDERLKALFLSDPNAAESEQLLAIKTESARYNIGLAQRNVNVPLYALIVLTAEHRGRFKFSLGRNGQSGGVAVQRLEFEEVQRPTLITDTNTKLDVPLRGSFAVDPLTGAICESALDLLNRSVTGRMLVRFRRDPGLGLWVPEDMFESWVGANGSRVAEAQASYEKFRRFQVKTEEKMTVPKR